MKEAETKIREMERAVKEAEISGGSASEQLDVERTLRLSLEANVKELQVGTFSLSVSPFLSLPLFYLSYFLLSLGLGVDPQAVIGSQHQRTAGGDWLF